MSIIARIFIAAAVCPVLGGIVGQDLARAAGKALDVAVGVSARWEMVGLLAGACAGLMYGVLTIYCIVGCGGRLRGRVADPVVLALGALAVGELLVHRGRATEAVATAVRGATIFAWLMGLLFVVLAIEYRPRRAIPPPPEADEQDAFAVPREPYEEEEDG
jgi:hypothetical protein